MHLTIAVVRYDSHGKDRVGVASSFVSDRIETGDKVKVYVHKNKNFRLPESPDTPIIMIGPGTGIAPFRAFLQEISASGSTGDSWLFFGDQHRSCDFLYESEWEDYLKDGHLTKMETAFSRDQEQKVYVQDKLKENAAEVFTWLEKGAHLYVCGDASRMAKDVQATLVEIISAEGGKSEEEAEAYLKELKKAKRYQRDVY